MNCPKCQERLRIEQYRENQYKICFFCEGAWVSKNDLDTHSFLELEHRNEIATDYECPCCENQLLSHTKIADIELEYCQSCSGVFFDKGELESTYPNFKDINGSELADDSVEALAVIYVVTRAVGSIFRVFS